MMGTTMDLIAWFSAVFLCIRGLCVLNRMSYKHWSAFSFVVVGLVMDAGYIIFHGPENKEISYPLLMLLICLLCYFDKRRTMVRRDRKAA